MYNEIVTIIMHLEFMRQFYDKIDLIRLIYEHIILYTVHFLVLNLNCMIDAINSFIVSIN